jgi:hypothetical protein
MDGRSMSESSMDAVISTRGSCRQADLNTGLYLRCCVAVSPGG